MDKCHSGQEYEIKVEFLAEQIDTPETRFSEPWFSESRFSEPQFSEILDIMDKIQLPFSYFTLYLDSM